MIPLPLDLIEPLGKLQPQSWATEITGLQIDSRRIQEGDLFVAIGDGADFAKHAFARGAAAVLIPDEAHEAMAAIGSAVRDRTDARIVGITGATGKTTTKDILAALCRPLATTVASEANYNNELGVPLTLARIEQGTELCIVEMGMRGLGQIAWLAGIARPHVGLITNVAPVHLELVETVENVARAKAELLGGIVTDGVAVIPEEPLLEPYLTRTDIAYRRFGHVEEPGQYRIGDRVVAVQTNYDAAHQLQNTLAALTVCDALGLPIGDGTLTVEFSPLREHEVLLADGTVLIDDSYNANPVSMRAALAHLAAHAGNARRIAVLGGMAELGAGAAAYHHEIAGAAGEAGVAELIAVGDLARGYLDVPGAPPARWVATADEAVAALAETRQPGDVVLIKGSRSVGLEVVAANLAGT